MELKAWVENFRLLTVGDRKRTAAMALGRVTPHEAKAESTSRPARDSEFPGMHVALLGYLKAEGADQSAMDRWDVYYFSAIRNPKKGVPCPRCFLKHQYRGLLLMPGSGPVATLDCPACEGQYDVPCD